MIKTIISEGKTTNEAIEKGLKELKVSKDMVEIKVLEEEKRSFYNILAPRVVKVELSLKEKDNVKIEIKKEKKTNKNNDEINLVVKRIEEFLNKFLKNEFTFKIELKEYDVFIDIQGNDVNYLIGHRGENIRALQTIISTIANKDIITKVRIFVDIAGYKEKREKTLQDLADKIARTVIRTGKSIALEPMTAYERKIIHTKLQNNDKVETISKGEEPYRKVVIKLKNNK